MKTALYTGSFDPITKGHLDIIQRSAEIFKEVIVGVGTNPNKKYLFSTNERIKFIKDSVHKLSNVAVIEIVDGRFSADIAYELNAVIVKGVRPGPDFDYERMMHEINQAHVHNIDTVIYPCQPSLSHVSSSTAKEVCKLQGNTEEFVPLNVKSALEVKLAKQFRFAVTGSIGAGKSTVVSELERYINSGKLPCDHRVHNIDLDVIANDILFIRTEPAYQQMREYLRMDFGMPVWERKHLGRILFRDNELREELNKVIRQPLMTRIRAELMNKEGYIVFNSALLCEADMLHLVNNRVVLLDVNEDDQVGRLKDRGYTDEQVKQRIDAQKTNEQKEFYIKNRIARDNFGSILKLNTSTTPANESAIEIIGWCCDAYKQ